jgi:hypothetical protein
MHYKKSALLGLPWAEQQTNLTNAEMAHIDLTHTRMHNHAIKAFAAGAPVKDNERLILTWCQSSLFWRANPEFETGYGEEHITEPLRCIWGNLLNLDLGRLDGGVLSEWSVLVLGDPDGN